MITRPRQYDYTHRDLSRVFHDARPRLLTVIPMLSLSIPRAGRRRWRGHDADNVGAHPTPRRLQTRLATDGPARPRSGPAASTWHGRTSATGRRAGNRANQAGPLGPPRQERRAVTVPSHTNCGQVGRGATRQDDTQDSSESAVSQKTTSNFPCFP